MSIKPILSIAMASVLAVAAHARTEELQSALRAVITADSYSFSLQENPGAAPVAARFQKGQPIYFKADKIEFFRKGNLLVYKQGDAWQRTRTGTLSDPLLILGASAKVRAARLPHEELPVLGKGLANIKKSDGVITGEFGAQAAKQLARTEDRDLARSGTARLWLDSDGRLAKYEIAIRVQGKRGNAEVDGTMTRTVSLRDLGKVKVEVPDAVNKLLEQ